MIGEFGGIPRYNDWRQVSGYSDGDGHVIIKVRQFVLILYLQWTDHSVEQFAQVERFLRVVDGISTRIYRNPKQDVFHLKVTRQDSVLRIAREMLPFTFKKRVELQVVADYYTNKITGSEAIALLNEQVEKGFRSARLRSASLPLTHEDAVRRGRRRSKLTDGQLAAIREKYGSGYSVSEPAVEYGKAPATIRKIIL